jgi:prophage antirepressor-like protein
MSIVYEELQNSRELIENVAKEINPLFAILKTYGTKKHPLCSANDVARLLEIKSVDSMLKGFNATECIFAKIKDNEGERNCKLLTKHGIYRVLFNSHTPLGEIVREFIYKVLDKLEEDGVVHLENIQKEMNENFIEEIKKSTAYLRERVSCLESEIYASNRILRRNTEIMHFKESENNKLSQERQALKMKINQLQKNLMKAELDETRSETTDDCLFKYLKLKYMKVKVFIYLLSCKDDNDDHYNYKDFSIENPPDENDTMYYKISKNEDLKNGVIVYETCFETEAQFVELKTKLHTSINLNVKATETLHCELSLIIDQVEQIRYSPVIEKKKERRRAIENDLAEMRSLFNKDFY